MLVVEQHHVQFGRIVVAGQDASVHVFPFEDVGLSVLARRALNHKPEAPALQERREGDGCQLAFLTVDFHISPVALGYTSYSLSQTVARHGPDAEFLAVLADNPDNLFRVRSAVHPCLPEGDPSSGGQLESAPEGLALLELDVRVPVTAFDVEREPVNLCDAGEVAEGLLVRILGIKLLCRYELVSSSPFFGLANQSGLVGIRSSERLS